MNTPPTTTNIRLLPAMVGALIATIWLATRATLSGLALAAQSPVSPISPVTPIATPAGTVVPTATPPIVSGGTAPPLSVAWIIALMAVILIAAIGIALVRRRSSAGK